MEDYMDKIYLIQEVNFDRSENTISDAMSIETLGFCHSLEEAQCKIVELDKCKKYKSWESIFDDKDHLYPKFNIEEVEHIK